MSGICAIVDRKNRIVALKERPPSERFISIESGLDFPEEFFDDPIFKNQEWYRRNYLEIWISPSDATKVKREFEAGRGVQVVPISDILGGGPYCIYYNKKMPPRIPTLLGYMLSMS